jgi:hypothetical protein
VPPTPKLFVTCCPELLPQGRSTTYAISIAAPAEKVWPWLVQIGRGRGYFYTPIPAIERFLGADIDNLDRIEPSQQTLNPEDRIWMTPERHLGRLPGQFWQVRQVQPGWARSRAKTAREPTACHLVVGAGASSRRHDPTAGSAPQRTASRPCWFPVGNVQARWHFLDGAWHAARHQGEGRALTLQWELWPR